MAPKATPTEATMATNSMSYFGDVHAIVLRQHAEIRSRLRGLDVGSMPVAAGIETAFLRVSLLRLAALFEAHLVFEERELAPRIREMDAWGPVREAAMLAEHTEQRSRIQQICVRAEAEITEDEGLSREASALVVSLLEDMAREETELAFLAQQDEYGVDQMTG